GRTSLSREVKRRAAPARGSSRTHRGAQPGKWRRPRSTKAFWIEAGRSRRAARRPHAGRPHLRSGIDGMIEDARGRIDYEECGAGPTIVLVPGSCSTGAAWRPVIGTLNGRFRYETTSPLG